MKNLIMITIGILLTFSQCNVESQEKAKNETKKTRSVLAMTNETFKQKVFNYEKNKEWKFEGNQPVIIDFYADWCGPCRMLSPKVEEIAKEYEGKITVYKVDTDKEQLLAQNLGITSLPTLLFVPVNGQPQATMGALPKADIVKVINEVLLK